MADPEEKRLKREEKKVYRCPQIVFREPLEVIAAVCLDGDQKGAGDLFCTRLNS